MKQTNCDAVFEEQMDRIRRGTGKRTQRKLADFLGVKQSNISDAKRRGKIPADWLIVLFHTKNILPEWILTGQGACFMPPLASRYETGDEAAERQENEKILRRIPARMLADELVRRVGT